MPKHKRAGRPSLGAAARKRSVLVRLTDGEYKAIAAAVKLRGVDATVSGWLREHALAPLSQRGSP